MFLFERLFGVCVYMALLICVCLLLENFKIKSKKLFRYYLVCLCVMAFLYKPNVTADLYRVYELMDYFSTLTFRQFLNEVAIDRSISLAYMLYWFIGKIGVYSILPALSAFVSYSVLFYIINKTQETYSISGRNVSCVLFFVMTTSIYLSTINGIRMMLALSMLSFCYFRSTVEKKLGFIDVLFYCLSIFIHAMSVAIVGILIAVVAYDSRKKTSRKVWLALLAGALLFLVAVFATDLGKDIYEKFLEYIWGDKHSDTWEYIMGVLIIALLSLAAYDFSRLKNEDDVRQIRTYSAVTVWAIVIALCMNFEFSIFYRFGAHVAVLFSVPSLMVTLERSKGRKCAFIPSVDLKTAVMFLSIFIALISCSRGSLSALKFFELG